jgi:hypothetical protein
MNTETLKLELVQKILNAEDEATLNAVSSLLSQRGSEADRSYSIEDKRKDHPNAYMLWTKEDDDYLEQLYCEKLTIKQLSVALGRNQGAIRSRISKLELAEKYG